MRSEIYEQPGVVDQIAAEGDLYREVCAAAAARDVRFVVYAARGTSDNAAVYGQYLANILGGLPAGLAAPSTVTLYGAEMAFRGALVFGISQSGRTVDVAEYLASAGARGAFTVAITNEEESPLADAAHLALVTHAGSEHAVPATKTYTSQLATLAMVWATWSGRSDLVEALRVEISEAMTMTLELDSWVAEVARSYRLIERLLVTARGVNYATALEAALKLQETCYLQVAAYSAADLAHGPIASVGEDLPVLAIGHPGPAYEVMVELTKELRTRGTDLAVIAPAGAMLDLAEVPIKLPGNVPEILSPLIAILPAQLFAYHLAREKGIDPDHPRGLSKVTHTR